MNRKTFDKLTAAIIEKKPLIHCMTNRVADNYTANCLLAMGASPAMIYDYDEVAHFTALSSALLLNVGTITKEEKPAFLLAARTAADKNIPWVLDPVASGVIPARDAFLEELLGLKPWIIRGNAGEILALAGRKGTMKGVDSLSTSDEAREAADALAQRTGAIVAVTGKTDLVTDGKISITLTGGSSLSTYVTGLGCALSAMCAAFLTVTPERMEAAYACLAFSKTAQETARSRVGVPAAYSLAYIDELYVISHAQF